MSVLTYVIVCTAAELSLREASGTSFRISQTVLPGIKQGLPVLQERPGGRVDRADVRNPELPREEVRLRTADNGELERGVELSLDFGLEHVDGRDDVPTASARLDD